MGQFYLKDSDAELKYTKEPGVIDKSRKVAMNSEECTIASKEGLPNATTQGQQDVTE